MLLRFYLDCTSEFDNAKPKMIIHPNRISADEKRKYGAARSSINRNRKNNNNNET